MAHESLHSPIFKVFLTEDAKKQLKEFSDHDYEYFSNLVKKLSIGQWDNGARVKKLHSLRNKRTIYEARVDHARRTLFTLMPSHEGHTKYTSIIVFHPVVAHDDVVRKARVYLGDDHFTIEEYAETPEISPDSLSDLVEKDQYDWSDQVQFHQQLDFSKKFEIDETALLRFFVNKEDKNLPIDLLLCLNSEQRAILEQPLPILLSGTAGSGKTTILMHKALVNPDVKKLYITYSDELRKQAQDIFSQLTAGLDHEPLHRQNMTFATFEHLLSFVKKDQYETIVNKDFFMFEYQKYACSTQIKKNFPALMIWEEIRGVWKGGAFDTASYIMTKSEYLSLTEEQAPNFFHSRIDAYKIFEWYQYDIIGKLGLLDEQDLLHDAIIKTSQCYDMILCDEVQDLTMQHIAYLFKLTNYRAQNLLMTGDDHQTVHHSGFRWENIKNAFHSRLHTNIGEITKLTTNYRNSGSIAKLSNGINRLQHEFTEFDHKSGMADTFDFGDPPVVYHSLAPETVMESFSNAGPQTAVIVRSEEERVHLSQQMNERFGKVPLIFTVSQVKGLEFENAILWRMFPDDSPSEAEWQRIQRKIQGANHHSLKGDRKTQRFIRYEVSMLYVAVTRAMRHCAIYDGFMPGTIWSFNDASHSIHIRNFIAWKDQVPVVTTTKENSYEDAKEWFEIGLRLFKKKLFHQAAECFSRVLGDEQAQHFHLICQAEIYKEAGEYDNAGSMFSKASLYDKAIQCWDVCGKYKNIDDLCKTLARTDREHEHHWKQVRYVYKSKNYEREGKWYASAVCYNNNKCYLEAIHRYLKDLEYRPNYSITIGAINVVYKRGLAHYASTGEIDKANALREAYLNWQAT